MGGRSRGLEHFQVFYQHDQWSASHPSEAAPDRHVAALAINIHKVNFAAGCVAAQRDSQRQSFDLDVAG